MVLARIHRKDGYRGGLKRGTQEMLPRHQPDHIRIAFDDHRLVNNTGLILPATLALHLGLPQLVDRHLDLGRAPGRANTLATLPASARRPWPPAHGGPRSRGSARDPNVEVALNPACGGVAGDSNPVGVRAELETPLPQSLPQSSAVTGSRPTLALVDGALDVLVMVDELTGFHKSGPMPSMRPISWGSARNRRDGRAERPSKWRG